MVTNIKINSYKIIVLTTHEGSVCNPYVFYQNSPKYAVLSDTGPKHPLAFSAWLVLFPSYVSNVLILKY